MGTGYLVTLDLKTTGSLDFGLNRGGNGGFAGLNNGFNGLVTNMSRLREVGAKYMGVLDGIAHKLVSIATVGAVAGGSALFAAAYTSVAKLNNELEGTQIALASIFQANHKVTTLSGGFALADIQIQKMRQDAKQLPGEFEDLRRIFVTTAIPGFEAGASADRMREFSKRVMTFAAISHIPQDVAAREAAILLEGRAGAHNLLGMRLAGLTGAKARSINEKDPAERLKYYETELTKYTGADVVNRYAQSFEGLSTTLVDNVKQFGIAASGPLFDKVKGQLGAINNWFDNNQAKVHHWADAIGKSSAYAFDYIKYKIQEWWPVLEEFAHNAKAAFESIRKEYGPLFDMASQFLKDKLRDPNLPQQLETGAKAYAGAKTLAAVGGVGVDAAIVINAVMNIAKYAGSNNAALLANTAAVDANTAARGGAGAKDALAAAKTSDTAEKVGTALWLAAPAAMFAGALARPIEKNPDAKNFAYQFDAMMSPPRSEMLLMVPSMAAVREEQDKLAGTVEALDATLVGLDAAAQGIINAWLAAGADPSGHRSTMTGPTQDREFFYHPAFEGTAEREIVRALTPKTGGGHGGTSIQKVEIVVTTNQHPSRVARSVVDELAKLSRNQRVSKFAPNFSKTR